MPLHLDEALQMENSSRANFEGDERNFVMAILTHVKVLSPFSLSNLFEKGVETDGKLY